MMPAPIPPMSGLQPLEPVQIGDRLLRLHHILLALLHGLAPDDWQRPTVAVPWTVQDMVAHLLDTDLRRVASLRDGYSAPAPEQPITDYATLVRYIDQLNDEWVKAARRLSPQLLCEMLALIGPEVHAALTQIDPYAPAKVGVAWAGERSSPHWFDVAREYTEKWHHQQHIREAVGAPLLTDPDWLAPVLDTFVRGLPHTYRQVAAPVGAQVVVEITGAAGGTWTLVRGTAGWQLWRGTPARADAWARLDQDTAWRRFTKGISQAQAAARLQVSGDRTLGLPLLELVAIMA